MLPIKKKLIKITENLALDEISKKNSRLQPNPLILEDPTELSSKKKYINNESENLKINNKNISQNNLTILKKTDKTSFMEYKDKNHKLTSKTKSRHFEYSPITKIDEIIKKKTSKSIKEPNLSPYHKLNKIYDYDFDNQPDIKYNIIYSKSSDFKKIEKNKKKKLDEITILDKHKKKKDNHREPISHTPEKIENQDNLIKKPVVIQDIIKIKITKSKIAQKTISPEKNDKNTQNNLEKNYVTFIEKGGAVVDNQVPKSNDYYVLPDVNNELDGQHFNVTLNMSNLKNNNNKFYLIQVLYNEKSHTYQLWNRWGRVGSIGQRSMFYFSNEQEAKISFFKKLKEKQKKGYEIIQIDYSNYDEIKEINKNKTDIIESESSFDKSVKNLIELIFDLNIMNLQMKEIGYDAIRMPLGKLSKQTISDGYNILTQISSVLKGESKGDLYELSSRFYTIIPHNFGYK